MKQQKITSKRKAMLCAMVSSALLLGMTGNSYAEEQKEYSFDQIVVTATKTPVKEFEANANITVITREQIEQRHYRDIAEALRDVPGVYVSNYGAGGEGYAANSFKINGTSQVVVLIDGIRANTNGNASSVFQATEFNAMDNVERIEILKGSASTLYGSDAKGGVINIITRKAAANQTTLNLIGGSYDKENYSFVNQGQAGDYSWIVTSKKDILGNYTDAHGLEIPQHQNVTSHTVKITKRIDDASDITLNYDQYKADYMRSNTIFKLNERNYGSKDNYRLNAIYNYKFSDNTQNQLSIFTNRNRLDDKPGTADAWLMDLETRGIQNQLMHKTDNHTIVGGFDFYQDKIIDYKDSTGAVYRGKTITNRALYIQDEWAMTNQWKLTSGIRQDHHSYYGNHTTPSITLGYKQNENTNYFVAYKEYFVAPNQYQLFSPYGNFNLKPETGDTVEAGIHHKFDDTLTGVFHLFKRKSKDKINWAWSGPGMFDGRYMNVDKESAHGWDVQLNKKWSKEFNTYVGYTHTTTDPEDTYMPKGTWNVGLNYEQQDYSIAVMGKSIVDKPGAVSNNGPAFPKSTYWVWDMAVNYQLNKAAKVFVKVNNIFDQYYAEYTNVVWGQTGEWYPSPGRNYYVGLQYNF